MKAPNLAYPQTSVISCGETLSDLLSRLPLPACPSFLAERASEWIGGSTSEPTSLEVLLEPLACLKARQGRIGLPARPETAPTFLSAKIPNRIGRQPWAKSRLSPSTNFCECIVRSVPAVELERGPLEGPACALAAQMRIRSGSELSCFVSRPAWPLDRWPIQPERRIQAKLLRRLRCLSQHPARAKVTNALIGMATRADQVGRGLGRPSADAVPATTTRPTEG